MPDNSNKNELDKIKEILEFNTSLKMFNERTIEKVEWFGKDIYYFFISMKIVIAELQLINLELAKQAQEQEFETF